MQFKFQTISGSFIVRVKILSYEEMTEIRNNIRAQKILQLVEENPGIHYSDLIKIAGLAHGTLSHYLLRLEKMKLVRIRRDVGRTFIFTNKSPETLDNILIYLRKETAGRILAYLLHKKTAVFSEIREASGKSPSTVSLLLTQLVEINLVRRKPGIVQKYELVNRELVLHEMETMKVGKMDAIKDRFSDTFSFL